MEEYFLRMTQIMQKLRIFNFFYIFMQFCTIIELRPCENGFENTAITTPGIRWAFS